MNYAKAVLTLVTLSAGIVSAGFASMTYVTQGAVLPAACFAYLFAACALYLAALILSFWRDDVRLFSAWYDAWIGAFYDRRRRILYVFFVPFYGVAIQL